MATERKTAGRGATARAILKVAARLVAGGGLRALTFDAVAARLGVSKQAVLYWFPTKSDLLGALALPAIEAEAAEVRAAAGRAAGPADAARAVTGAVARFHLADLDRFRLVYLAPQFAGPRASRLPDLAARVHPVTAGMYDAVEQALGGGEEARRRAVALHCAGLGVALMAALADAADDPLRHPPDALRAALGDLLAGGPGAG